MFRLTGGHLCNMLNKTHRCHHHDVYHQNLLWVCGAGLLYEVTHWCSFTAELLGSV